MKTEDIDKKIGMPDVNDEWAKFESEVINKEEPAPKKSRRPLYIWLGGLGIAASLLLLLMMNMKDPQAIEDAPMIAQVQKPLKAEPVKEVQEDASAVAVYGRQGENGVFEITTKKKIQSLPDSLIAKVKAYEKKSDPNILVGRNPNKVDMREYEGLPSVSVDQVLQGRIAGLKIENWSDEDKKDAKKIHKLRKDSLITDTLSDAYVNKHPKLRKNYRRIQGYVLDENYKPLTNAWVNVWGKNAGAATGENGYFSFWMLKTDTLLEARNVGFRTTRFHPADTIIFIRLKDATTLRDVKVKARNRKNGLPIPYREVTGKINMEDFEGIKIKIDEVEDNTAYVVPASQIAPIIKKSSKKSQPKSITFKVDENLKALEKKVVAHYNGKLAAQYLLSQDGVKVEDQHVVAMSFADAQNLRIIVKDAFYQCIVKAYAEHKSVTLSPDMMWLLISQGFARYVNAHSEELRSQLVYHEGKQDLMVMTKDDLLSGKADWGKLMNDFSKEIERHTKGEVAKTIAADFSTTTPVERIASQITLMESMKSYFNYLAGRIGCGIPSITLQGTPDDWRAVFSKTQKLGQYGLSEWTQSLEPILNEFIKTAEGKPNQRFWQEMVKKKRVDEFASVRPCSADKPTELDGWILKFFPTESGYTLDKVPYTKSMPAEFVRVEFKYRVIDPITGATMSETPMELMSGFIGAKEDEKNNMLTPQIGWLVRACE